MKRNLLFICFLMALLPYNMHAQSAASKETESTGKHWYVGVQGGVPFGVSTFSSFGADKTRFGWATGAFVGYRLNPLLSMEFSAKVGQTTLSVREGDAKANYWLGSDMVRYHSPVVDMVGWDYNNLTSKVNFQQYALQLNVDILRLFRSNNYCPWILELSPIVSAIGTRAHLNTIAEDAEVMKGETEWHLGVGGNVQVGYRVSNHLSMGVYGGITYMTGNQFDKLPKHTHKTNNLYEGGLKLTWLLGKGSNNLYTTTQIKEGKR